MTTEGQNNGEGEKLYAGKFKTVQELEDGYNNSAKVYQENDSLKKKFEEVTKVPDVYNTPTDIALHEADLEAVKEEAKNSALTQAQYEKLVRERNARSMNKHQSFEQAKKDLGADNLNVLQDFISKTYPEKLRESVLKQAIQSKEVRDSILAQRSAFLNTSVPGAHTINTGGGYAITEKDVLKAREDMNSLRGRPKMEAQKRYIAMQKERAHAKQRA